MSVTIAIEIILLLIVFILIIFSYIFLKRRNNCSLLVNKPEIKPIIKDLKEIENDKPNNKKDIEESKNLNSDNLHTSINISSKTEKEILRKLDFFEKNNGFTRKNINLKSISREFNTNSKYLSEVIKTHRNKQFNTYLNELRINYIVNRLLNDPNYTETKIIYLASDSGFTSHSAFTTVFTQLMNESPSTYIKRIKKDAQSV